MDSLVADQFFDGVYPVRKCEIALAPGGQDNLMMRVQALLNSTETIDIQALILKGDATGLLIAEVLKLKMREGVKVSINVDALSNLDPATQLMYFDLWLNGAEINGWDWIYLEVISEFFIPNPNLTLASLRLAFAEPRTDLRKWALRQLFKVVDPKWIHHRFLLGIESVFSRRRIFAATNVNKRYHDKLFLIDARRLLEGKPPLPSTVAFMGGSNLANEYARIGGLPTQNWTDSDIAAHGAIILDYITGFMQNSQYMERIKQDRILPLNATFRLRTTQKVANFFNRGLRWVLQRVNPKLIEVLSLTRLMRSFSSPVPRLMSNVILDEARKYAALARAAHAEFLSMQIQVRPLDETGENVNEAGPASAQTNSAPAENLVEPPLNLYSYDSEAQRTVPLPFEEVLARFFHHRPRLDQLHGKDLYLAAIDYASRTEPKELLIANAYFAPGPELMAALEKFVREGGKLTLITNSIETNDLRPLSVVGRSFYARLMRINPANVDIREWSEDPTEGTIHAKFMIINGHTMIEGSYNWDQRSEGLNSETLTAITTLRPSEDNPGFAEVPTTQTIVTRKRDYYLNDLLPRARKISFQQAELWEHPRNIGEYLIFVARLIGVEGDL